MREFSGTRYKCQINILLFQGSISARNSFYGHEFDIEFASMYLPDVYQDLAYQDFTYQDFAYQDFVYQDFAYQDFAYQDLNATSSES